MCVGFGGGGEGGSEMRTCLWGFSETIYSFPPVPDCVRVSNSSMKLKKKSFVFQNIFQKIRDSLVFSAKKPAAVACAVGSGGRVGRWAWGLFFFFLDHFVRQVVAERRRDGERLHLLRGHDPAERHPGQVLQAGGAARNIPEVHAAVTSPCSKDTSFSREGTAEAVGEGGDGLGGSLLDAPEANQPVVSDAGDVAAVRAEAHGANPAVV